MGIPSVAIYSSDDEQSSHRTAANEAFQLTGIGVAAYLDIDSIITIAKSAGADAVHPGYGFLSENSAFAAACESAGINFVGPSSKCIQLFGDKTQARKLAQQCNVPVNKGSPEALSSVGAVRKFISDNSMELPVMLKAVNGGGGRGIRVVEHISDLATSFDRCVSEAEGAFGSGGVFVEAYVKDAKHIEVQVLGDEDGNYVHLFERDCSVQERHQKVVEIAPARGISSGLRQRLTDAAIALVRSANYSNAGTVEFLVGGGDLGDANAEFAFIEVNPRIQVEHTVTEEVTGVDLIASQLQIAMGRALPDIGLEQSAIHLRGFAVQLRITQSTVGRLTEYVEPAGGGVRVDSHCYRG